MSNSQDSRDYDFRNSHGQFCLFNYKTLESFGMNKITNVPHLILSIKFL